MTKFFISPGDPAGIGPEITLKALSKNKDLQENLSWLEIEIYIKI